MTDTIGRVYAPPARPIDLLPLVFDRRHQFFNDWQTVGNPSAEAWESYLRERGMRYARRTHPSRQRKFMLYTHTSVAGRRQVEHGVELWCCQRQLVAMRAELAAKEAVWEGQNDAGQEAVVTANASESSANAPRQNGAGQAAHRSTTRILRRGGIIRSPIVRSAESSA